jgi:predicted MPP superfamily phosphohydrolase
MKSSVAIIFFSVAFIIYTSLNYYILVRLGQATQQIRWLKISLMVVLVITYLSFFGGFIMERTSYQGLAGVFKWITSNWLAFFVYFLLSLLVIDILRLISLGIGFIPDFIANNYALTKLALLGLILFFSTFIIIVCKSNAVNTKVKQLSLNIDKKNSNIDSLKILFASDIHLGATIKKDDAQRLVDIATKEQPDIILFGGDILDGDIRPAIANNSGEPFKNLIAPMGIFAITGNHEYISGDIVKATEYLESINIKLIRDSVVNINNAFYIAGREDKDMERFTSKARLPINKLVSQVNGSLPMILMDHQPFKLEESAKAGVDLHLSGHTHHAQMWPLNYITEAVFEKSWGYLKKENTHFYISCGFGVWGAKVRIGSHSEVAIINVNFVKN